MCRGEDIAYVAGLFEGEGCIQPMPKNGRVAVRLVIKMTDLDPLERVQSIFGGTIRGPYQHTKGKPSYCWALAGWEPVVAVMTRMAPWLGQRRLSRWAEVLEMRPAPYEHSPDCGLTKPESTNGAQRHYRRGEKPCRRCAQAKRDYYSARAALV